MRANVKQAQSSKIMIKKGFLRYIAYKEDFLYRMENVS